MWFPEQGFNSARIAKKFCRNCDVTEECLNYALQNNERYGVWGGTTEHERRVIRRELKLDNDFEEDEC